MKQTIKWANDDDDDEFTTKERGEEGMYLFTRSCAKEWSLHERANREENYTMMLPRINHFAIYFLRLCCMCACTNVLAARAASKLISPAKVAAATTMANFLALAPGSVASPPRQPTKSKQAA